MANTDPFDVVVQFAKHAAVAPPQPQTLSDLNTAAGLSDVGHMGIGALAVGAGARGLTGLYNLLKRNIRPPQNPYPGALVTRVPVPVEDEEAPPLSRRRRKSASAAAPAMPATPGVADYRNQWWYAPSMLGAGALGMYGGWKSVDDLLNNRREADSTQDVEDSRKDFEQAMLESYPKPRKPSGLPPHGKLAGDQQDETTDAEKLSAALDELYEKLHEKKADFDWTFGRTMNPDTTQGAAAMYGVYGLGSALLAGKMTYDSGMKTNGQAVLRKAIARRNRKQFAQRPSEMLAVPDEIKVPGREFAPGGEADLDAEQNADPSEPSLAATGDRSRKIIRGIL
jgi:hypothetical protein